MESPGKPQPPSIDRLLVEYEGYLTVLGRRPEHRRISLATLRNALCPLYNIYELSDCTPDRLLSYFTDRAKDGWAQRTHNNHLSAMSAFFKWCKLKGYIEKDPTRQIPKTRGRTGPGRRAFTPEEVAKVVAEARRDETSAKPRCIILRSVKYHTAYRTGLRSSELLRIRRMDVVLDDENPRIVLRAQDAKDWEERILPIDGSLVEELRAHCHGMAPDTHVFRFTHPKVVKADIIAAGVPFKVNGQTSGMHSFRKALATELAKTDAPLNAAMQIMGHSDPRLTARTYVGKNMVPLRDALGKVPDIQNISQTVTTERQKADILGHTRSGDVPAPQSETRELGSPTRAVGVEPTTEAGMLWAAIRLIVQANQARTGGPLGEDRLPDR